MDIFTAILVFVVIWWLCFFLVLPFGANSQSDEGVVEPGTEPGAPVRLNLVNKALTTTVIAVVIWAIVIIAIQTGVFSANESTVEPWAK